MCVYNYCLLYAERCYCQPSHVSSPLLRLHVDILSGMCNHSLNQVQTGGEEGGAGRRESGV